MRKIMKKKHEKAYPLLSLLAISSSITQCTCVVGKLMSRETDIVDLFFN
jgi:hypothetical protein